MRDMRRMAVVGREPTEGRVPTFSAPDNRQQEGWSAPAATTHEPAFLVRGMESEAAGEGGGERVKLWFCRKEFDNPKSKTLVGHKDKDAALDLCEHARKLMDMCEDCSGTIGRELVEEDGK